MGGRLVLGGRDYWKWPFIVDLPIKTVIFHSYVTLPEGIQFQEL